MVLEWFGVIAQIRNRFLYKNRSYNPLGKFRHMFFVFSAIFVQTIKLKQILCLAGIKIRKSENVRHSNKSYFSAWHSCFLDLGLLEVRIIVCNFSPECKNNNNPSTDSVLVVSSILYRKMVANLWSYWRLKVGFRNLSYFAYEFDNWIVIVFKGHFTQTITENCRREEFAQS
jgi:hypothetical protein